jgi:hypothetical protein
MSFLQKLLIPKELEAMASDITVQPEHKQQVSNVAEGTVVFKYEWQDGWANFVREFWRVKV